MTGRASNERADQIRIADLERHVAHLHDALSALGPATPVARHGALPDMIGFAAPPSAASPSSGTQVAKMIGHAGGGHRARKVRDVIRLRRHRETFFPADYFADPVWDMMLDLYAAHLDGQSVSVSSLCIAAGVPATTALRSIKLMTDAGVFVRTRDERDGRRVHIHLAPGALAKLEAYFEGLDD